MKLDGIPAYIKSVLYKKHREYHGRQALSSTPPRSAPTPLTGQVEHLANPQEFARAAPRRQEIESAFAPNAQPLLRDELFMYPPLEELFQHAEGTYPGRGFSAARSKIESLGAGTVGELLNFTYISRRSDVTDKAAARVLMEEGGLDLMSSCNLLHMMKKAAKDHDLAMFK